MTSPRVAAVGEASLAEWRRAVKACPWATFFQSPDWYLTAATALLPKHRLVPQRLEVGGTSVVLPFMERDMPGAKGKGGDRRGNAVGVYGGWLAPEALDEAQGRAVLEWLAGPATRFRLRMNPFHPPAAPEGLGLQVKAEETSVLDASKGAQGTFDGYSHGQQDNIAKARRVGVTTRVAAGLGDWDAHIRMNLELQARWGDQVTLRYEADFLRGLATLPTDSCRLWLAELDSVPHAGLIVFYQNSHVAVWHASSTVEQRKFYAFKLLLHSVLEDAAARGYRWYDLMPSHDLKGTEAWKRFLGTQSLSAPMLMRDPVVTPAG
ncbi:MAG: GNAT family N-acetyltransferase [Thermoplasmatota archaeon]